jgi:hypothetical protein
VILIKRLALVTLLNIALLIPILSVFLVTNIGHMNLVIALLVVSFSLLIPGSLFLETIRFKTSGFLENIVLGTAVAAGLAVLVHPLMGFVGLGDFSYLLFIIIGIVFIILNFKNFSLVVKNLNLKLSFLISFLLIPFGIWVGRQANVVPINNFDNFSVPPDIYHHLSIAAEIGNHGPEIYPYVAGSGVSLQYHWGAFSLGSFLNAGDLISLPIAMFRVEFILLSFLLLTLLFFTGKFAGKSNLAGVIAALFGVFTIYPSFAISDGLRVPLIRTGSISQLAAGVFLVAALRIFLQICESKKTNYFHLVMLSVLVMATTLSKGPTGLLLLGIIGLTAIIYIFSKEIKFGLNLTFFPLIGFALILPVIFTFGPTKSSGMSLWFSPLTSVKTLLGYYGEPVSGRNLLILSIVLAVSCLTPFLILLLNLNKKPTYLIPLIVASAIGILGLFIFEAWGNSQWFIYYPVGLLLAISLSIILPSVLIKFSNPQLVILIVLGLFFQNVVHLLLRNWLEPNGLNFAALWVVAVAYVFFATLLISLIIWKLGIYQSLVAASITLLSIGVFSTLDHKDAYPYPVSNYEHPWSITKGTYKAASFIKDNSSIEDVVATNRHCVGPEESNTCISRVFTISALAERRTFVEGWAYTTCPVSEALNNSYWNKPHFELNQQVVLNSDEKAAQEISAYGVKWLLIDLRRPHSKDLSNIASKEFSAGEVEVWKLNYFGNSTKPILTGCQSL